MLAEDNVMKIKDERSPCTCAYSSTIVIIIIPPQPYLYNKHNRPLQREYMIGFD